MPWGNAYNVLLREQRRKKAYIQHDSKFVKMYKCLFIFIKC